MSDTTLPLPKIAKGDLWRGRCVIWLHAPRGGYGFCVPVRATVVGRHGDYALIDAEMAKGGTKRVRVKIANLRDVTRGADRISIQRYA